MNEFFSSTKNTRPIADGSFRYIRSDVPLAVTESEADRLVTRNIVTVVDLRSEEERKSRPCPLENDGRFVYLHMPVTGGNAVPPCREQVAKSYLNMVDGQMERIVDTIWNARSNVLYFCSAGKDRTGVVTALLLRKLGADDERIIDDYLKSAENLREELARAAAENPDIDLGVITPDRSYMEEFLRSVSF